MASRTSEFINKVKMLDPGVRLLADLRSRLDSGSHVDVKRDLDKSLELMAYKQEYCQKMSSDDTPCARRIYKNTVENSWGKLCCMYARPDERGVSPGICFTSQILQFICRMQKAKTFLEVGMFTGYVSMAIAEVLPDDGRVVTCELDQHLTEMARKAFDETPHGNKIEIRQGDAKVILKQLAKEGKTFDLVYIDADESGYLQYYQSLLDLDLLAPGGTVALDNTFHFGQVLSGRHTVIDTFNKAVHDDHRVDQILLPLSDGLTLIRRKNE